MNRFFIRLVFHRPHDISIVMKIMYIEANQLHVDRDCTRCHIPKWKHSSKPTLSVQIIIDWRFGNHIQTYLSFQMIPLKTSSEKVTRDGQSVGSSLFSPIMLFLIGTHSHVTYCMTHHFLIHSVYQFGSVTLGVTLPTGFVEQHYQVILENEVTQSNILFTHFRVD